MYGATAKKLVSVAKLKSIDNGVEKDSIVWDESYQSIKRGTPNLDRVMGGYLKYYYYLFVKEFGCRPQSMEDLYDGMNFIYFYNNEDKR